MPETNDREKYWLDLALANLSWFKKPSKSLNSKQAPFYKWFEDGELNIAYNCLDIHLENKLGNKTALIFENEQGKVETYTYAELHELCCKVANFLQDLGLVKGDALMLYMPSCPEAIATMLACTRLGIVHSVVFAGFSKQALLDRIEDLQAKALFTSDITYRKGGEIDLASTAFDACASAKSIKDIVVFKRSEQSSKLETNKNVFDFYTEISKQEKKCEPARLNSEDRSFVLYTSGSTGKPKGIVHTSAGYLLWAKTTCQKVFGLKRTDSSDVFWCTADIGWITGHSYLVYGPLAAGGTCFLYEGSPIFPDPARFWQMIEKHAVSIFYTAPTAIRMFMQAGNEFPERHDLSSLRILGTVGEPINPAAWHWFNEVIGKKKCPIADTWWQTETGGHVLTTVPFEQESKAGAAGKPLPGIELELNEENKLLISSPIPSMLRGVHGNKKRFLETYWTNDHKYITGDIAHIDNDGYFSIEGRFDDVINVSGHRLGTAEIESALVAHEKVFEAAIVARRHEVKGEAIYAFVVSDSESKKSNEASLKESFTQQISQEIGSFAKPEKVYLVPSLPKTRSGKIMRRILKELLEGKEVSGDLSTIEDKSVIEKIKNAI